jgi:integrase
MPLTDVVVRNAKPKDKPQKLTDGDGMFLYVHPNGGKYWRLQYRFAGKQKVLALGVYPEVSLADARERRMQARKVLAAGNDPGQAKKEAKRLLVLNNENTFEAIAREWHEQRRHEWTPHYAADMLNRIETHIIPKLGKRPIADLTSAEILAAMRIIEATGALDLTQRMLQTCGMVIRYAIATGRAERNPVADLRGALKTPVRNNYIYLRAHELPEYLQKLENFDCLQTKLALKLLLLTFVRTTELRAAEWQEVDFDKAEWRIPASRMKMKETHIVPLARQTIEVLRELQTLTGNRRHMFPNHRRPVTFMSENAMLYALYRMGYHSKATGHGFRATASTILNEHGFMPDVIERQLAHCERNSIRAAYNHAQYLPERRKMMQWWADYIDELPAAK